MVSDSVTGASTELRKRRSTRIVQAVPLVVTGVDALGRPFVERTSSLIINCHGCRYQSKHYVLKNMWVTMEIPHQESGQPPRTVRGRVAWIQRPRTVRQLFQVALELEVSGNVWGIAFPPEDWVASPEMTQVVMKLDEAHGTSQSPPPAAETDAASHLGEAELPPAADNLRLFPSPTSATDASLQLARQVARLVADAKQQIQAATREAVSQAVSAERRLSFEQWEQKFAAGRAEIANETAHGIEKFQQEADEHSRTAHAAAAEALRTAGQIPEALEALEEALAICAATGECFWEAEIHRLRGEMLPVQGEAEACFRQAADVARRQGSRSLELRAVTSLARLFREQGRPAEARPSLGDIYGRFTEGFETADLQEAKALLGE